jgi:hypothetical protein
VCRGSQSRWTRDPLCELGFQYDSNALNDDLPYWDTVPTGRRMLILPYGFDSNDMKYLHPNGFVRPSDLSDYVSAALDVLVAEGGQGRSSMLSIGLHLRICGRPARFHAVRLILARLAELGDKVWIARRREIAAHFRAEDPIDASPE